MSGTCVSIILLDRGIGTGHQGKGVNMQEFEQGDFSPSKHPRSFLNKIQNRNLWKVFYIHRFVCLTKR